MGAIQALGRSFLDLFRPRILLLMLVPPVGALIFWGGLAYLFWDQILLFTQAFGERFLFSHEYPSWLMNWFAVTPTSVTTALAVALAILFLIPLVVVTALLVTSFLAMPLVVAMIAKDFPGLERKGQAQIRGSVKNLVRATLVYLVLWVVTMPLWVVPGLGFALPLMLNGYLNYRLFTFDALAEHASPQELEAVVKLKRIDLLLLGVVVSALVLFPPMFFILPIYGALVFTRFSLTQLANYRAQSSRA
ncbi:MAG: hypothetical protein COT73_06790 [Bdellovibrio sp. CG10_big_fil_rev_8_21_14_0_10_47_8]|nr:MAG: hypothetical protein COT73_06790 [Bdellovibrio sp. CG10_big_fil_rev_8_21_14_0_10_47_8]